MSRSPRHLLTLHKALADHLVDRRLDEARGDRLAMTVAVPVVHDNTLDGSCVEPWCDCWKVSPGSRGGCHAFPSSATEVLGHTRGPAPGPAKLERLRSLYLLSLWATYAAPLAPR